MQKADKKLIRLFKGVWTDETATMNEKLDSLDALAESMFSISLRTEFRKWRFQLVRDGVRILKSSKQTCLDHSGARLCEQ